MEPRIPPEIAATASVRIVASLEAQFLPRCPACHERHPLACQPPMPAERCHACHHPLPALDAPVEVPAAVAGWRMRLGDILLKIGAALARFANKG